LEYAYSDDPSENDKQATPTAQHHHPCLYPTIWEVCRIWTVGLKTAPISSSGESLELVCLKGAPCVVARLS